MRLYLAGLLSFYDPQKKSRREIPLPRPVPLVELLQQLEIPAAEIAIAAVNGAAVPLEEAVVSESDEVDLYPPVGGG